MSRKLVSVLLMVVLFVTWIAVIPVSAGADTAMEITGSKYVAVGKSVTLKTNTTDTVKWSSSNKKVATVSQKGVVKGVKSGSVTITAKKTDGTKATWKMTVKAKAVESIKITADTETLDLVNTKTVTLKAKASPSTAAQSFTWKSSDKKVATVSSSGKVTAKGAGKVKITATARDGSKVSGSIQLTVEEGKKVKVGVSMPTDAFQRWALDGSNLKSQLKKAGYDVTLKYADNNDSQQLKQVKSMINNGCSVIIIAAVDPSSMGEAMDLAKEKGVKIIGFDRMVINTDALSYYVTFDNTKVGKLLGNHIKSKLKLDSTKGPYTLEITAGDPGDTTGKKFYTGAMSVLKPYIESGVLVVTSGQTSFDEVATTWWKSENAQERAEGIINDYYSKGNDIDAWLCVNDSTALGVIHALENCYSGSKWPVITGQDCDIANMKYVIAGKQSMSAFKDTSVLVSRAVKMVKQILEGSKVETNGKMDNGSINVPSYLCAPVAVDKSNYKKYLIDTGFYTEDMLN